MPIINVNTNKEKKINFDGVYDSHSLPFTNISATIDDLPNAVLGAGAGSNQNYAIFAGGQGKSAYFNAVTTYNSSLTKGSATALAQSKCPKGANTINKVFFAGGNMDEGNGSSNSVESYNNSLTKSTLTPMTNTRKGLVSVRDFNANGTHYVIFAGGYYGSGTGTYPNSVDAYSEGGTKTSLTVMSYLRANAAGAKVGSYALISGGYYATYDSSRYHDTIEAYNQSFTKSILTGTMSCGKAGHAGASNQNYALFSGDYSDRYYDAVNGSLTISSTTAHSSNGQFCIQGVDSEEYAIFYSPNTSSSSIYAFNNSLTLTLKTISDSFYKRRQSAATTISKYVLIGGGYNGTNISSGYTKTVIGITKEDEYDLSLLILPFSKYKFTESTEQTTYDESVTKNYITNSPISGYIKPNANNHFTGQISTT